MNRLCGLVWAFNHHLLFCTYNKLQFRFKKYLVHTLLKSQGKGRSEEVLFNEERASLLQDAKSTEGGRQWWLCNMKSLMSLSCTPKKGFDDKFYIMLLSQFFLKLGAVSAYLYD